jgi:hypothetical protein
MNELYVPPKCRGTYKKAMSGRSQRAAIRAYCLRCCNWRRNEVKQCTCPGCPLFFFRLGRGRRRNGEPVPSVPAGFQYTDGIGRYVDGYEKALRGESRRVAIRAACLLCSSWSSATVRACRNRDCPLWLYRLTGAKRRVLSASPASRGGQIPAQIPLTRSDLRGYRRRAVVTPG